MQKILIHDQVIVRSGKDRGKKGKVTQILPEDHMIVIEGVNKVYRHIKPQKKGESGQRIEVFGPIKTSNVMLVCPACNKPTRVGVKLEGVGEKAKKVRVCKKCKKIIQQKKETKKK